jgi:glutamate N-acetyltransferase/amino-acid N-acetyltransferase
MQNIKISTTNSGIKYKNRDDLLLIYFDKPVNIAGVFTQSSMSAAPVLWCRKNIKNGTAKALLVNAGNANCFTGKDGIEAVKKKAKILAANLLCNEDEIFICSTGVIGEKLDVTKIENKLPEMVKSANFNQDSWLKAAQAIMTSDTKPKLITTNCQIGDKNITIAAIAKGAGMISPNMATLLSFIFTDANISANILSQLLKEISEKTFNSITIDSDTSTNDTLLLFATKEAKNNEITDINDPQLVDFKNKLYDLCLNLSKMIVLDGEGVKKLIKIKVKGATNSINAKEVARAIGNSPLIKSAIAAADPNWGRIIMAIGKSCPNANQEHIDLKIGDFDIVINGEISPNYNENKVHQYLKNEEVTIEANLNLGNGSATVYGSDLNEEYVTINKDYRT